MSTDTEIVLDEKISLDIKEPKKCKVVFLNDDGTPMEFVIDVLQNIYKHTHEIAVDITMKIHTEGSGIVGVYSHEIAEMKATETTSQARNHGFPLQVKIEEE
jgi:ATP-dependent Clp protease adaptor protein ClpS